MSEENYLTLKDAAKVLGIHVETARRYVATGEIPARKLARKRGAPWRVAETELHKFMAEHYDPRTGQ